MALPLSGRGQRQCTKIIAKRGQEVSNIVMWHLTGPLMDILLI